MGNLESGQMKHRVVDLAVTTDDRVFKCNRCAIGHILLSLAMQVIE